MSVRERVAARHLRRDSCAAAWMAWTVALLLMLFASAAAADEDDLPGRVGRIADVAGPLFLSPDDRASDWAEVGINYPVTSGDNLWVGPGGRAEVDYGGGQFRLAGETNVHVSRLDDRQLALFLAQGRIVLRIRVLEPGDVAYIDAPNTQVQLTRAGLYRIEVAPDRQATVVTVREGEALVALVNGAQQALPGQTVTVSGADQVNADLRNGTGIDGFDAWSANRDRYYERSRAAQYVSRQMVGYADLDDHGSWQTYPEYGPVWFPSAVAPDWAPYSDGYWTSVGAWGFTWVDFAPWGYAPSHYGRWAHIGGRWGWCPGLRVARPVWAPALVAWHGGPRWGLAGGDGSPVYGWVPLGWRDPYLPPWRGCSSRCWANLNQPYGVDVRERPRGPPAHYTNAAVPGAITAIPRAALVAAQPVGPARVRVPPQYASAAPVLGAAPPVSPGRMRPPAVRTGPGAPPPVSAYVRNPGNRGIEASIETRTPAATAAGAPASRAAAPAAVMPAQSQPVPTQPAIRAPASPSASMAPSPARPAETPAARVESPQSPQRPPVTRAAPGPVAPAYGAGSAAVAPAPRVERSVAPAVPPSLYAPSVPAAPPMRAPAVVAPAPVQVVPQVGPQVGQPGPGQSPPAGAQPARTPAASREAPQGPTPAGVPAPMTGPAGMPTPVIR